MRPHHSDLRRSARTPKRQAAWIGYGSNGIRIPCMIWDISTGGARLAAGRSKSLPATFTLITSKDGKSRYHCRVAWRNEGLLGVQFVQTSEADEDLHAFSRGPVVPLKAASPRVRGLRGPTLKLAERRHRTTG